MHPDRERIRNSLRVSSSEPLFRDDSAAEGITEYFDRNAQIKICAGLLESLRQQVGEKWWALKSKKRAARDGSSELKFIVSKLIRWSAESVDFARTFDFITKRTYQILEARKVNSKINVGQLTDLKGFTHEHMVPCEAILKIITKEGNMEPLAPVLAQLSYRALVEGTERAPKETATHEISELKVLDRQWSKSLPPMICLHSKATRQLDDIDPKFYPLLRYEIVGMLGDLMPVNGRAENLLIEYEESGPIRVLGRNLSPGGVDVSVGRWVLRTKSVRCS
jgi:hypothetical protein